MRFSKLVLIAILLVVTGFILIYLDQSDSKTRICNRRIRKAQSVTCTWTLVGETRVWALSFEEDETLFTQLQEAMLADLKASREEKSTESIPEYRIGIRNWQGKFSCDFDINTGSTTWIECNRGIYPNRKQTLEFLKQHEKQFIKVP